MTERQIAILLIIVRDILTEMRDVTSSLGDLQGYKRFETLLELFNRELVQE